MSSQAMDQQNSKQAAAGKGQARPATNRSVRRPAQNRLPKKKGATILEIYRDAGMVGTEFRRVCDNIGWIPKPDGKSVGPKSVVITSAMTSEGKSTVAAFLAITSAIYLNQRTVLLDCDLRRPAVHRMFHEPLPGGVSDCLNKTASLEESLRTTDLEQLKVLTAGSTVADPTALLNTKRWTEFMDELAFYFDRIVIDCAPLLPVDDAVILGRAADGVVMVIKAGETQREVVGRATQIIRDGHLTMLGIVLNNLKESLPYYYNHKYYGYRYQQTDR